jgi:hypothetical protein
MPERLLREAAYGSLLRAVVVLLRLELDLLSDLWVLWPLDDE